MVFAIDEEMNAPHAIDTVADVEMVSAAAAVVGRLLDQANAILAHVILAAQRLGRCVPEHVQIAHVFAAPFAVADFGGAGFALRSSLISDAS